MDDQTLTDTRLSLHGVAESVIAGPQFRAHGTIRLAVTPGGFGGVKAPLRVTGTELVGPDGRWPLAGTLGALAAAARVELGTPGNYHDSPDLPADHVLAVDPAAAALIADAFARGDAAMREFAPEETPTLWPEHFDVGISVGEVNYGVSPGDAAHPRPYAYVGPWSPPPPGGFWNAPFGALRWMDELPGAGDVAAFFAEGRAALG
jgi:hypothetical protein